MTPTIKQIHKIKDGEHRVFLATKPELLDADDFSLDEMAFINKQYKKHKKTSFEINRYTHWVFVFFMKEGESHSSLLEKYRKAGDSILPTIRENHISKIAVNHQASDIEALAAFAEGMALGNYQFLKYKKDKDEKESALKEIRLCTSGSEDNVISELNILVEAVCFSRNLINEPLVNMTAKMLANEAKSACKAVGVKVEVLNQLKIEAMKMGGLLAVNRGSLEPPTFTIMEWKPAKAVNKKPIVLVGKGVVYDTGGMSLKPTASMVTMKCDMSGAAAVIAAIYAIAKAEIPVYVVGLVPATENRVDGNAYVPGDVVTMLDGTTVEVLNTDAEGRLILADALTYAKKYEPELVIDLATLTGSASAAIGKYGIVAMGQKSEEAMQQLEKSGHKVYERLAIIPFWEEYGELIRSEVGDIKNTGGKEGGAITAGKFLAHFTDYPWIHLDIAGPAFLNSKDSYRGAGGTGTGVRLLFDFVKSQTK